MSPAIAGSVEALGDWMLSMSWQFAVVVAAALVIDRLLARFGRSGLRHVLWCLVGLKLVLPPQIVAWWRSEGWAASDLAMMPDPVSIPAALASPAGRISLLAIWLVGFVGWFGIRFVGHRHLAKRIARRSRPAPPHVIARRDEIMVRLHSQGATPRIVLVDDLLDSPMVFGWRRPTIALPASALAWREDDFAHALAHELAHVTRRDLWIQAAWSLLRAAYWFHPLVHVAARHAHAARELACDATVAARFGGTPYRQSLLRLAAAAHGLEADRGGLMASAPTLAQLLGRRDGILLRLDALAVGRPDRRRTVVESLVLMALVSCALPLARPAGEVALSPFDLALATAEARREDPSTTGSLHVRWAMLQLAAEQQATSDSSIP